MANIQSLPNSGLTFENNQTKHWQYFKTQTAVDSDPGTGAIFYNPSNGTDDQAGAINTTAYTQALSVDYKVGGLGSTGIDLTIWGRFGTSQDGQWSILHTEHITAASTVIQHIEVEERPQALRVGVQATGTPGADTIDVWVRGQGWVE